ncbi:hypothetical protein [Natronomonas sp. EA1]|uniref:hypothetical protein n=1 Tax=Natronomonas sp. EA1 TaxID=3421655 RepID=UPI003EBC2B2B
MRSESLLTGGVVLLVFGGAALLLVIGGATAAGVVDIDGDGIPPHQELLAGTDPLSADSDGDELDDDREAALGTEPLAPDTDRDGIADGTEVKNGTDPTSADDGDGTDTGGDGESTPEPGGSTPTPEDEPTPTPAGEPTPTPTPTPSETPVDGDDDNLTDARERELGTNPEDSDSDDDGLADGEEVAIGSDPLQRDTDGDGLSDREEVEETGTDPTTADSDGDGLSDPTELDGPTDPMNADTDGDGLNDRRELNGRTDALDPDTDDDGLPDGPEVDGHPMLPDARPLHKDIYVEIDHMSEEQVPRDEIKRVIDAYNGAPVENPDGSTGITLHVVYDEELSRERATTPGDLARIANGSFDHAGYGYHYALAVADARSVSEGDIGGFESEGHVAFETVVEDDRTGPVFMHMLGHAVGLDAQDYRGIDSTDVEFDTYPSVMNYNAPPGYYDYADDDGPNDRGYDDWAALEAGLEGTDVSKLLEKTP